MKIAEGSDRFNIATDSLRYYERIGLIQRLNRRVSGFRDYSEADLKRVEFIKCMRGSNLPIEALIEYVSLVHQGDETSEARKNMLIEKRNMLAITLTEIQKSLNIMDQKIEVYKSAALKKEKDRSLINQEIR